MGLLSKNFPAKRLLTNLLLGILSLALGLASIGVVAIYSPAGGILGSQLGNHWFPGFAGLISWFAGSAVGLLCISAFLLLTPRGGLRFFWIALCGMLPLLGFFLFVFSLLDSNPFKLSIAIDIVFLCLALVWIYKTRRPVYAS